MLTCDDVREHLAAIETGEPAPGDVRDHLATCEACRAEAQSLREDLGTLRIELASLAPSPFLEDAVLAAARSEGRPAPTRRSPWLPAGIGVAAAAVLALLVFTAKLPSGEHAAGEGTPFGQDPGGPSLVEIPPTRAEVAVGRRERLAKSQIATELRFQTIVGVPPPGMAVVGRMLLNRLGPKREGYAGAKIAFDQLTRDGRQQEIVVTIGAPGWRGATAKVRARVVLEYTGNLILEECLARALGLHAFEVPGGVTLGGDYGMRGEQSRASIRIGGRDLETNVEVLHEHVPLPAVPLQSGGLPQALRVVIRGELPDNGHHGSIGIHHAHDTSFVIADVTTGWRNDRKDEVEFSMLKQGPLQAALSYHAGEHPECIVFLPSLDIGGGGPLGWAFRMERVALKQTFEPGAMVTVARVWRGRTAIPSRESVAHTWAGKGGKVSFVHQRGERGPLRAREVRKDGTVHWHDLAVRVPPKNKRQALAIDSSGHVRFRGMEFPVWSKPGSGHTGDATALAALRRELGRQADAAGRDDLGTSQLIVALVAAPDTVWKRIEGLLMVCVHPDVRVSMLLFVHPDEAQGTPYQLPADRGLHAVRMKRSAFTVRLVWQGAELRWQTRGVVGEHAGPLDESSGGLPALRAAIRAAQPDRRKRWFVGTIAPVGAARKALPYAALPQLIETLQAGGVDQVLISNTPPRKGP